ncbi:Endonuclease/exonuclease/phosphatase [Cinara cedri]|uniref:Endonuclease/exonuclease/phosphatase n=1 Tax=Cinara cedri TaxID=506608 RepID=A0A5E4N8G1_9HEMI|nr:Endonuclease/exonuclease/phosphatase [Cinara cedri]
MTNNTQNQNHIPPTYKAQDKLAPLETIVQWNINSYYKTLSDIHHIIAELHHLALCLQETNFKNQHKEPNLKNYHGYFKNRDLLGRASDFNSRNIIWGSDYTDRRGRTIEKLLEDDSIILLNDGNPTRHNSINSSFSAIDLTIVSTSLGGTIDWTVQTSYCNNDHWPITLRLLNSQVMDKISLRWLLKTTNWQNFSDMADKLLAENHFNTLLQTNPSANIDSIVKAFTNALIEAAEIGKSQRTFARKKVPWWNNECKTTIQNYKKALNKFRKTRLQSDHIILSFQNKPNL